MISVFQAISSWHMNCKAILDKNYTKPELRQNTFTSAVHSKHMLMWIKVEITVIKTSFFSNFFNMFCPQFYSFRRPLNGSSLVPDWSHIWPMVRWPRPCPFCCSSLPRWIECPPARPACEWELCPHRMAVQSLSYCPWLPWAWTVNSSHIFTRFSLLPTPCGLAWWPL